jgi:hypothetical protein
MLTLQTWGMPRTFLTLISVVALVFPAVAQSVISTHSGVVYYFDGAVYLDDKPLESHLGKFLNVPQGSELRTAQGHAEVVLTPGVFLRMGDNSAIRMLSNDLANTRVELQTGSAIVDSSEPSSGTAVTLVFRDWQVHAAQAGTYRVDSDPPRVWVLKGEAEVTGTKGQPARMEEGMDLPLTTALRPEPSTAEPADSLSDWNNGRSDSIIADNSITQQIDADPATQTSDLDGGFSYFPFLGVPVMGMGGVYSSPYTSVFPAQPGFYSMYLPGYTYAPRIIVLPAIRPFGGIYRPPFSVATVPGRSPVGPIVVSRPTVPVAHPAPASLRPLPHHAPAR